MTLLDILRSGYFIISLLFLLSPSLGWVQGIQNSLSKSSGNGSVPAGPGGKCKDTEDLNIVKGQLEEFRFELETMRALLTRINRNTKVLRSGLREMMSIKRTDHSALNEYSNVNCPYGFDVSTPTSCYKFMPERASWYEAQARCGAIRAHLLSLESDAEQRFISKHLSEQRKLRNCDVWTGGTDVKVEGVWRWNHTGNVIVTSHWHTGEPNNSNGREDCAWMDWYFDWSWNDASCDRDLACFVCEVDV